MTVKLHGPSDVERLRQLVATERRAIQRDRYRVVLLAAELRDGVEMTRDQIARAVGRSRQFVDEWVGRYRRRLSRSDCWEDRPMPMGVSVRCVAKRPSVCWKWSLAWR
jgi:hypothetical protein